MTDIAGEPAIRAVVARIANSIDTRRYHVAARAAGGSEWMVAGQWIIEMTESGEQWLVTRMTLRMFYQTGNRDLLAQAAAPV
jgi:hypothetical protein